MRAPSRTALGQPLRELVPARFWVPREQLPYLHLLVPTAAEHLQKTLFQMFQPHIPKTETITTSSSLL